MKTTLHINDEAVTLEGVQKKAGEVRFELEGKSFAFRGRKLADGGFVLEEETAPGLWSATTGCAWPAGKGAVRIQTANREAKIAPVLPGASAASTAASLSPAAPMPGLVRQLLVKTGDKVSAGQPLVVMEAMKLQTTLSAGGDGIVEAILVKEGEQVTEGAELVRIAAVKKG